MAEHIVPVRYLAKTARDVVYIGCHISEVDLNITTFSEEKAGHRNPVFGSKSIVLSLKGLNLRLYLSMVENTLTHARSDDPARIDAVSLRSQRLTHTNKQ